MDWQKGENSDNVEEGSGGGGGGFQPGGVHLGLGGLLILLVLSLIFKRDLITPFLGGGEGGVQQTSGQAQPTQAVSCQNPGNEQIAFACHIMGSTEKTWGDYFAAMGKSYTDPRLHLFQGQVATACGAASTAVGPFYCPGDRKVYLDLGFFQELQDRFHASGDFARAYVIAHEVGHHVQNLLGVFDKVQQLQQQGYPMDGADGLSVRQELQADCFAGVWANRTQQRLDWLQPGDVESALNAASAVGDDTLQKETQGRVMPDTFTHGTSAQRVKWFKAGMQSGDINSCNTFAGEP
ncbi:neutral zinc metallopeptidase [Rhodanobacter sp. DHB23]|uniref:KPN_02809 family neutral zinc metallopeptidase n=1 Tax=Rhodanobacter sp. DHB23 TaxID=2775923 RepID=UPI001782C71D|nr:neutral zinc metallopeptidase [Rhodanobacter sp. DHB23]MBD8871951.1 neutral zinc metallopeptidase [Rhodanobacter sp. DHB23]